MTHSKGPWTLDEHGDVRDANGKRLRLVGVSLACGYSPNDHEPEANRALVAASTELVKVAQMALASTGPCAVMMGPYGETHNYNGGVRVAPEHCLACAATSALKKAGVEP